MSFGRRRKGAESFNKRTKKIVGGEKVVGEGRSGDEGRNTLNFLVLRAAR